MNSEEFPFIIIDKLKNNKFNMYKLITTDSEAYKHKEDNKEIQTLAIAVFYDGENYYKAKTYEEIIKIIKLLIKKYEKITIVAHNYKYDARLMGLIPLFLSKTFDNMISRIKMLDKIIYLKFSSKNNEKIVQFLDSTNYFKDKLSKLAEMIGYKKEWDKEYNLDINEWNNEVYNNGYSACKEDCRILYEFFTKFINNEKIKIGVSLASSSMTTYRANYLKHTISFPKFLIKEALSSYHGGIVMAYKIGECDKLHYYDYNSLYPKKMSDSMYSIKFHNELKDYKYLYDEIKNNNYNYLLNISYKVKGHSPVYDMFKGKLIPFLENTQWITGKEYQALYELNAKIKIHKVYEFHNSYLFKDFVKEFYYFKENAENPYERNFYKIILNSLYGKFGQHKATSELIDINKIKDRPLRYIVQNTDKQRINYNNQFISIYNGFISVLKELPVRYNPLIASEVTANARLENFYCSKDIIGFENLYYTDTDSFFTNKELPSQYVDNKEMGKLKLEDKQIINILGVKDYEYIVNDTKHNVIKGIPKNAIFFNESGIFKATYTQWSGLKSQYDNNTVVLQPVTKELKRENTKMKYIDNVGYEWLNKKEAGECISI